MQRKGRGGADFLALDQGRHANPDLCIGGHNQPGHEMRKFLVTFHKTLPDDTGHEHRVLQRQAVVSARSEVSASYEAKAMLCKAAGVADWRLRADTCEVVELALQMA